MPYRDSGLACPRCQKRLSPVTLATGHEVRSCDACDGVWITPQTLAALARALAARVSLVRLERQSASRPLSCPQCFSPMKMTVRAGIEIDECIAHGLWLDFGELQRLLSS